MSDLFQGAEQVIAFIGGRPDLLARDSHTYLTHRHNHYYSGMIHLPETTSGMMDYAQYSPTQFASFDGD